MYIKHCKLSKNKQLELMKYFITGATARTVADLVGIHRNSAVRFFHKLRVKIALKQQDRNEQFSGTVEQQITSALSASGEAPKLRESI